MFVATWSLQLPDGRWLAVHMPRERRPMPLAWAAFLLAGTLAVALAAWPLAADHRVPGKIGDPNLPAAVRPPGTTKGRCSLGSRTRSTASAINSRIRLPP